MKQLFENATLRLTGWYLIILACISILFSVVVYQIAIGQVERSLSSYQSQSWSLLQRTPSIDPFNQVRLSELDESRASIIGILLYMNAAVLTVGGGLSYLFAKRTLRPIEEAHETQTRFVSDASHELRTPLAAMTTELEVALADPHTTKQELRDTTTSTLEEVQRLTRLTSVLLALSSGDNKQLTMQPFRISESLQRVVERFEKIDPRIHFDHSGASIYTLGNQSSIEELLATLLDNSLQHSPSSSPVKVTLHQTTYKAFVKITNHGRGIEPQHLPHIFDRFYRVDSSRTGTDGYGLGLALAQQIASLHHTTISVKSAPGKTTTFSFALPVVKPPKK